MFPEHPSTPATMPRFRVPIRPGPVQSDLRRTVCFLGLRRTAGQRGQQERSGGGKLCPRGEGGRGLRGRGDAHERGALLMSVLSVLSRSRCRGARPWTCDPTGATRAGHPLAKPPRSVMLEESSPRLDNRAELWRRRFLYDFIASWYRGCRFFSVATISGQQFFVRLLLYRVRFAKLSAPARFPTRRRQSARVIPMLETDRRCHPDSDQKSDLRRKVDLF
ncbi:unnamed protein product [Prorocentrum cordatum]|uniref:Uncharacterized protein n=1 Tax=Prorocentrum cordatum TaxID=2364126 RepID=A0ABN9XZS0_9DINO|nr:unnamed protein product [Polarella glacialis]